MAGCMGRVVERAGEAASSGEPVNEDEDGAVMQAYPTRPGHRMGRGAGVSRASHGGELPCRPSAANDDPGCLSCARQDPTSHLPCPSASLISRPSPRRLAALVPLPTTDTHSHDSPPAASCAPDRQCEQRRRLASSSTPLGVILTSRCAIAALWPSALSAG